jgi:hypothetical protein
VQLDLTPEGMAEAEFLDGTSYSNRARAATGEF